MPFHINMTTTKICIRCGNAKPHQAFGSSGFRRKDGVVILRADCRDCYKKAYSPQKAAALVKDPRRQLLYGARCRSKKMGAECTITLDDINIPDYCPILCMKLERGLGRGRSTESSPTIDRIDPNGFYRPENIRVISKRANSLKSDMNREGFSKRLAQKLIDARGDATIMTALVDYCAVEADLMEIEERANTQQRLRPLPP